MRRLATLLVLVSPLFAMAGEEPWVELLAGDRLDAFTGKTEGWSFAKSVSVDASNAKRLTFERGSGIIVNGEKGRAVDLYTKEKYGDIEIHLEFFIPKGSNSGVKFHGLYEIQICDSFGKKELTGDDCGGIYPRAELKPRYHHIDKGYAPKVNACKAPGEWQTLEAIFQAPRIDKYGKKTTHAKIVKAILNGQTIHENQEMETPTGNNYTKKEMDVGPLMLQGDHGPVAFRNVKVRPWRAPGK